MTLCRCGMPGQSAETYGKTNGPGVSGHDGKLMGQASVVCWKTDGPGFSGYDEKLIFIGQDGKLMGQVSVDMMEN